MAFANQDDIENVKGSFNLPLPTMGGKQFWTDLVVRSHWRVQQNSETGHYRLLDAKDIRHAWGSFEHCCQTLVQLQQQNQVLPDKGELVILLHGLIRTHLSMATLKTFLAKEGYATIDFRYASTRKQVGDHAMALKSVIDHLSPEVTDIYLVAHSLGNIVIRRYLADTEDQISGSQGDLRIRRCVMIGPPNQGSQFARLLSRSLIFHMIAGKSGAQLSNDWETLEATLCIPKIEFGIIAGGQITENDWNNGFLNGPDDFTVTVEETRLPGASDFLVKPLLHTSMMHQKIVLEATRDFLKTGCFVSEEERNPIPRTDSQ